MKLYRYWIEKHFSKTVDGTSKTLRIFGYSNESPADADQCADDLFAKLEEKIKHWKSPDSSSQWDYPGGHPIREEILNELSPQNILTRNRYGAEVLNSESHVFVDVDFLTPRLGAALLSWFRKAKPLTKAEYTLKTIFTASKDPFLDNFKIRIYQTKSGYRLLVQNCDFAPDSQACAKLMTLLRADGLYSLLCSKQQCFRARLTPKPYRIKMPGRKFTYPVAGDSQDEAAKREWIDTYNARSKDYAVCRYLDTINGSPAEDEIIAFHDEATSAFSTKPLA